MTLAPIVLFVYNRPWHTQQTVESLLKNSLASQSDLIIYSDGAKSSEDTDKVKAIRMYLQTIKGFKSIFIEEKQRNIGLAQSVIGGVSEVINQYGKAIIMEDDMVCAIDFLSFMNDALHVYASNSTIFSISGYLYPLTIPTNYASHVCLLPRASSWGWGTWSDRWNQADWEMKDYPTFISDATAKQTFMRGGEDLLYMLKKQQKGLISSWAIRWTYAHYKQQAYCLSPIPSKIHNIGADSSGTHLRKTTRYDATIGEVGYSLPPNPQPDPLLIQNLQKFFKLSLIRRIINWITLS